VYTDQCTAFVKNIAPHTTDDELREMFAGCGQLQALRHLRQANGDSRVSCPPLLSIKESCSLVEARRDARAVTRT